MKLKIFKKIKNNKNDFLLNGKEFYFFIFLIYLKELLTLYFNSIGFITTEIAKLTNQTFEIFEFYYEAGWLIYGILISFIALFYFLKKYGSAFIENGAFLIFIYKIYAIITGFEITTLRFFAQTVLIGLIFVIVPTYIKQFKESLTLKMFGKLILFFLIATSFNYLIEFLLKFYFKNQIPEKSTNELKITAELQKLKQDVPGTIMNKILNKINLISFIATLTTVGPLLEEAFFRKSFFKCRHSAWTILISSFIFASLHIKNDDGILVFISYFSLSLFISTYYYLSKNYWLVAGVHILNNSLCVIKYLVD